MGSSGNKPRKLRRRTPKVPKYEEPNNIQLAGLTNTSGGIYDSRFGHSEAPERRPLGPLGRFFLWCLGRRRTERPPASEPDPETATG